MCCVPQAEERECAGSITREGREGAAPLSRSVEARGVCCCQTAASFSVQE